jgi:hypothetical protein
LPSGLARRGHRGYRLWRDSGYAIGALVAGFNADLIGRRGSVAVVAAARPLSARLLAETHQRRPAGARIG